MPAYTGTSNIVNNKKMTGLVYKSAVAHLNKDFIECRMKGNPESKELKAPTYSCGDIVDYELEESRYSNRTIHNIHERKNYIVS
jgi:putative ribosome biogenesis GTPase RsgA